MDVKIWKSFLIITIVPWLIRYIGTWIVTTAIARYKRYKNGKPK